MTFLPLPLSISLPARFVLLLADPVVLSLEHCEAIRALTGFGDFFKAEEAAPIMQLVAKTESKGVLEPSEYRGLFVVSRGSIHWLDTQRSIGKNIKKIIGYVH